MRHAYCCHSRTKSVLTCLPILFVCFSLSLIDSIEQGTPWEAKSYWANQEIPCIYGTWQLPCSQPTTCPCSEPNKIRILNCFGMVRSVDWSSFTNVSGQPYQSQLEGSSSPGMQLYRAWCGWWLGLRECDACNRVSVAWRRWKEREEV
jgi:hypothetical protein